MKDVQAAGEAFSPQNRTSSTSKQKKTSLLLWVIFALLDPDPADIDWIQMIRPKLYFKDAV
jgi:hypothetical protein